MAASFVGAGAVREQASGTTLPCNYPAGLAAGDLLVGFVQQKTSALIAAQDSSWTEVARMSQGIIPSIWVGIKYATGSESGAFSFTTTSVAMGQIIAFRGIDQTTPQDVADVESTQATANTNFTLTGLTTATLGAVLVYFVGQNATANTATPPATNPGQYVETLDRISGTACGNGGYHIWSSVGATGNPVVVFSGSARSLGVLLALRPAGASFTGTANFSGDGTLASTQKPGPAQTATLSGDGTLSTTAVPKVTGATATLSGSGTLSTTAVPKVTGAVATLSGDGALTTTQKPTAAGTVALSGDGTLTAVGQPTQAATGTATLSGSGTLATTQAPGPAATVTFTGSGTLTTVQVPRPTVVVALSGAGTLTTTAVPAVTGAVATLSGSGTLTTTGLPKPAVVAALSGDGVLSTTQKPTVAGIATLSGDGTLVALRVYSVTSIEWANSATGTGWVNPANAVGPDDSTYATWTSTVANAVSNPLEVGFGGFTAVPADATGISVRVRVKGFWS